MERECLECGFNMEQTDKLLHGQHINYSGCLHSNEYRRNVLADNVTAQVIRDDRRFLFLHVNNTPVALWFKEQFGFGQSETQKKGIRRYAYPFLFNTAKMSYLICIFFRKSDFIFTENLYFCNRILWSTRHIETTKRYAILVIGNVRNFQSQQESVAVRAYSVDWLLPLLTKVILTTSDLRSGISVPRFITTKSPMALRDTFLMI